MQGFRTKEEVQRFADMMEELCWIVATKHSGSLKGEHGTGERARHSQAPRPPCTCMHACMLHALAWLRRHAHTHVQPSLTD